MQRTHWAGRFTLGVFPSHELECGPRAPALLCVRTTALRGCTLQAREPGPRGKPPEQRHPRSGWCQGTVGWAGRELWGTVGGAEGWAVGGGDDIEAGVRAGGGQSWRVGTLGTCGWEAGPAPQRVDLLQLADWHYPRPRRPHSGRPCTPMGPAPASTVAVATPKPDVGRER